MARAKWMGRVAEWALVAAALSLASCLRAATAPDSRAASSQTSSSQSGAATAVAPDARLDGLKLVFQRSAAQRAELEHLLAAQQDAGSPSYHHWLTPEQFAARFGATAEQVRAASGWLSRQGFAVGDVARGGGWIGFSGTAAQVERAFAAKLGRLGGHPVLLSGNGSPVPAELGGVVLGVRGPGTGSRSQSAHSAFSQGRSASAIAWGPKEFSAQYDLRPLYSGGVNGTGIAIAVAGQAEIDVAALQEFRSAAGLAAAQVRLVRADGGAMGGSSSDAAESELALAWAGAAAPGAGLIYVSAGDALEASSYAVDQDLAPVLSVTYGGCERSFSAADLAGFEDVFAQANAEGITVVAAAGDAGAAACDAGAPFAQSGLTVRFPASSPHVTAVGASALMGAVGGFERYAPEMGWGDAAGLTAGGGGRSEVFGKPVWQQGNGVPADGMRDLPDLSLVGIPLFAENAKGGAPGLTAPGTAATAAAFAGVVALLDETMAGAPGEAASGLGNINARLYALAASGLAGNGPQVFHDVAAGSNAVKCAAGTKDCGADGTLGFAAGQGYDLATGLGSVDVAALVKAFPLGSVVTTLTLTPSTTHPLHGQAITLTATVSPSIGPTGTVVFIGPAGNLGTVTVGGGVATLTTNQLPGGSDSVTATYSGDSTYATSNATTQVTVGLESALVAATISPTTTIPGGAPSLSVTVSSPSGVGTPTGTVTATFQGASGSFVGNLSASSTPNTATAKFTVTAPSTANAYTMQVTCGGDSNFNCATPAFVQLAVVKGTTTTTLALTPNPPVAGSATTLTADVFTGTAIGLAPPSGTVQFLDNGLPVGTANVSVVSAANGESAATFPTTLAQATTHSLTAVYSGDSNWATSSSAATTATVGKAATTTTLSPSAFVVAYGANLTLTATASTTATGQLPSPTGTITFSAATQGVLGTATVTAGTGTESFSSSKLAPGLYTLTAAYSGDSVYSASTSTANVQVTVSPATVTVTASASPASGVMYGTISTVTATVQGSGATTPTGTITVTVPGVPGTYRGTLVANPGAGGSATVNVPIGAPPPGTYALQVVYGGDTTYPTASTTTTLTTIKGNTVTTVTAMPNPSILNVPTTLTATVAPAAAVAGATYILTGTVQFYDGTTALGTPVAVVNNQAVGSETFTTLGSHSVTAVYSGDTNWNTSTSGVFTLAVTAIPTTTVVSTNFANNTALAGANIIFTVVVSPLVQSAISGINSVPTGTVTFYDKFNNSFTTLGSATLTRNGLASAAATFQTKFFLGGAHVITAVYSGDANFLTSTAGTIQLTIQDFALTAVPSSDFVNKGSSAQVPILVTPIGGFTGTVAFGCQPPTNTETTCSVLPGEVTGGGGTVSLLIMTTAARAQTTHQAFGGGAVGGLRGFGLPAAGLGLAGLALLVLPRRAWKRRMPRLLALLIGAALACGMVGCGSGPTTTAPGGGGGTPPSDPGTPQGTITFVVTAVGTDGLTSVTHQMTYQVTVQ